MQILVTGGAGFIGKHLVSELSKNEDHHITVIDNFSTSERSDFLELECKSNVRLLDWDVTKPYSVDCELIYNLACPASPIQYQKNPVETARTNFLGAMHALELAIKNDSVVLQASTSEVYGDPHISPQSESYWGNVNPIGIRSCYDEGKRVAETLFFDFHREYGAKIKIARIFNTYGPGMAFNDGRVVSNFIIQALTDEKISIYGRGEQTRSFCYVSDTVSALIKLANSKNNLTGPVNIGNPVEITIEALASEIIKLAKSNSNYEYLDLPQDDPTQRKPDISLAFQLLGWEPTVTLETGINFTLNDFAERLAKDHA